MTTSLILFNRKEKIMIDRFSTMMRNPHIYFNDLWVSVVDKKVFYSEDGVNWTQSNLIIDFEGFMSPSPYILIILGVNGEKFVSVDGKHWIEQVYD